jgi:hypothetical protein
VNRDTNLKTGRLLCNRIYKLSYFCCKQTKHRENLAYRVRLSDYLNQKSRKEDETKFQPVHPTKEAPRKNQESRRGARAQRTHTQKKKRQGEINRAAEGGRRNSLTHLIARRIPLPEKPPVRQVRPPLDLRASCSRFCLPPLTQVY